MAHPHHQPNLDHGAMTRDAYRVTVIGAVLDCLLGLAKVIVGIMVGSAALVADGVHSFSDLVTDVFVLAATHFGRQAPDTNHPYGHGRIETLATLWLGSILIFVAGGIAWASLTRLLAGVLIAAPGFWAIGLAVVALLAKEWIFRFTMRVAKRVRSKLLEANAWHSRSDALSTVVVLIGLTGAQFGAGWLDAVAAVVVALMVGKIGASLLWESSQELVDTALPEEEQRHMRAVAEEVPDVHNVHDLRTRTVGGHVLLDLHIVVPPRVTVSEAHEIGNEVSRRLRDTFPNLTDVTFHVDPENDEGKIDPSLLPGMPLREDVEGKLDAVWSHLPAWQSRVALDLHYLGNRIDISIYVRELPEGQSLAEAAQVLREHAVTLSWVGRLRVWQGPGKA
ncbi:cation diffusion facilitator family transporter [Litchfieldella rifensis]|uniref:Cation diffusion facilitator family transporter n=1 Tax=Litchfieldella rifensis TaxID=762643 RepID=A0ABV7LLW7_9GAMM